MTLRATLKTKIWQGTVGDKFYRANHVRRTTVFHYRAGAPVYELISPSADVYMMQSYAQMRRSETITPMICLGLANACSCRQDGNIKRAPLDRDYALTAEGMAYVVNDDLYNSYQRRPK